MKSERYYRTQGKEMKILNLTATSNSSFSWLSFFKYLFYIFLIFGIGYLLYWAYDKYYYIRINIADSYSEHYLYSLLNLSALSSFVIAVYNSDGIDSKILKIVFVILFVVIAILGIERLGISVWINAPFLHYKHFVTNGKESIQFLFQNLDFLTIIYATSFLAESNN
ncbi:MAG: hypothetical protein GYA51_12510 [Candidatus Methanofastidiosa archaeon]|nr:hypothetical protein [Candidatus Methanofastidiosa archaeon]